MNLKSVIGIFLFVIGIVAGVIGIAGVGLWETTEPSVVVEGNRSLHLSEGIGQMVLPLIAGLSLALGGLLIGLGIGDWTHPRAQPQPGDEKVNPEGYHKMKHV